MNEKILKWFKDHPDAFISGEQLSKALGCSRTAVWKHIQSLKQMGYEFESYPRLGYRLVKKPPLLHGDDLLSGLRTKTMGRNIHLFPSLPSTQEKAHELAENRAPEGTLVIAEEQTAGRGRMGKKWHSPFGRGIWMSLILRPPVPLMFIAQLTLLTAVALCRTLRNLYRLESGIKWPNDLLVHGKKISGILLESSAEDERLQHVVAGIGISANLRLEDFPPELHDTATSILLETGKEIDRGELIREFLFDFENLYLLYLQEGFGPIRTLWETMSVTLGRPVQIQSSEGLLKGTAEGIDEYGALWVRDAEGKLNKVYSGEIQFRGPAG